MITWSLKSKILQSIVLNNNFENLKKIITEKNITTGIMKIKER